jgi:glutamate carboxypeptidase
VLNGEDAACVDAAIRALEATTPGTSIEVAGGFGRPPMERTKRNEALFLQARRIAAQLGMDLQEVTAGGGSDGNTTSQNTATLDGLGIIGDGAHSPSERIDLRSLVPRTALLAALLMEPVTNGGEGKT